MKLRLQGNSVRLRLSRSEVEQLASEGLVEESVELSPAPLVYMAHLSKDCSQIEVSFLNGWITVSLPEAAAQRWAASDEVGMQGVYRGVTVLVEKDFSCLHGGAAENEDKFPNPAA